jgi:hypothetical protein
LSDLLLPITARPVFRDALESYQHGIIDYFETFLIISDRDFNYGPAKMRRVIESRIKNITDLSELNDELLMMLLFR